MAISAEEILAEIGPVQEVLDAHDGVVNVIDTSDGNIMLSLDGGCNGCSSTPMTAMQIFYSLMKLETVNDVIFVNGELPEYMRDFIKKKMEKEASEANTTGGDDSQHRGEIVWLLLFFSTNRMWISTEWNVDPTNVHSRRYCDDNT